jgi:MAF protein
MDEPVTGGAALLILASASPRRKQILAAAGVPFEERPTDVDESPHPGEGSVTLAQRLAIEKAVVGALAAPGLVALGADTVVALGDEPLGKPADSAEARSMLRRLRAREHTVITAVAAARLEPGGAHARTWSRVGQTRVWMRWYSDAEIDAYVASGDPFDKAGGYAIQHPVFQPVERIEGCYLTVVGLPLLEVMQVLDEAGLALPRMDEARLDLVCPGCMDRATLIASS